MGKSIKGTRTEKNLGISFAGESQARMRIGEDCRLLFAQGVSSNC